MRRCLATTCLAGLFGLWASAAFANPPWVKGLPDGIDLKPQQLFAIQTSGPSSRGPDFPIKEFGTGFAIAPKVIITAKHVTLAARDFQSSANSPTLHLPMRTVELTYPEDATRRAEIVNNQDVWVTSSPVATVDAARLDLDTLTVDPLDLSVCPIQPGETYYLIKFRQSQGGSAKNVRIPVAIPIRADADITARSGSLRRFELVTPMLEDNQDRPIGGDSGSPIWDSAGRVIGLLTALQGSSYLWVTPTQSFFDLVPTDVKSSVACNSEVTFANLEDAKMRLEDEIAALASQVSNLQTALETSQGLIAALQTEVASLEQDAKALEQRDTELLAMDKKLEETDQRLDKEITDTDMRSTTVLTAMLLKAEERGQIPGDVLKETLSELLNERQIAETPNTPGASSEEFDKEPLMRVLSTLFEQEPVLPTINRMKEDLGEERWGFWVTPNVAGLDRPLFNIGYERGISLPLISREMVFCMRPLFDFRDTMFGSGDGGQAQRVDPKLHSQMDYKNVNFYLSSEEIFTTGQLLTVCERAKQLPGATKSATYSFQLETDPLINPRDFPELDVSEAPARFYGYAFDRDELRRNPEAVSIMHRFVLEMTRTDDGFEMSCYYFDEDDIFKAGDALAEFSGFDDPADKEIYACPTL